MIHFLPLSHVILICNQTRYYHVISKLMMFFEKWMGVQSCEQGEKHWTQHASLRSASCEGGGGVFSHSNLLWPVCDEVHDPCKQGGVVVAEWLRRWT